MDTGVQHCWGYQGTYRSHYKDRWKL